MSVWAVGMADGWWLGCRVGHFLEERRGGVDDATRQLVRGFQIPKAQIGA